MFQPPGFSQQSVSTSLGEIVYYISDAAPWIGEERSEESLPTLVFLHGFGGGSSAYEWSKVYPAFASEYRILAPDLIGWGKSAHPERNYQIDDYLKTITEFLEATCDEPTTVIASSLTAAFVIRVAIARPELFKSLILTTPAGLSDFGENYTRSFFAQLVSTPILDRFIYGFGVANELGIRSFLEQRQFARLERVNSEMVQAYLASAQQPNAEYSALSFVRGDLCFDLSNYITQLKVPTAIIWGRKSQFTGPDIGRRLAQMNPSAIKFFQVIEEVGLTPQLELPAVTIGLIRRFLTLLPSEIEPVTPEVWINLIFAMIFFDHPLHISRWLLSAIDTKITVNYQHRIPSTDAVMLISNHRSLLDAPVLMAALNRPVRFACHHYMSQVPILREMIMNLGAFPLDAPQQRQKKFFSPSHQLIKS